MNTVAGPVVLAEPVLELGAQSAVVANVENVPSEPVRELAVVAAGKLANGLVAHAAAIANDGNAVVVAEAAKVGIAVVVAETAKIGIDVVAEPVFELGALAAVVATVVVAAVAHCHARVGLDVVGTAVALHNIAVVAFDFPAVLCQVPLPILVLLCVEPQPMTNLK